MWWNRNNFLYQTSLSPRSSFVSKTDVNMGNGSAGEGGGTGKGVGGVEGGDGKVSSEKNVLCHLRVGAPISLRSYQTPCLPRTRRLVIDFNNLSLTTVPYRYNIILGVILIHKFESEIFSADACFHLKSTKRLFLFPLLSSVT